MFIMSEELSKSDIPPLDDTYPDLTRSNFSNILQN